ncbi:hypothetical protein, partial [Rhizobium leguminosarum]|uniref:hypothetical protein n=1 Tax=Rhizobium leguminosarum TaxID=384 RepID=UPI003F95C178
IFDPAVTNPAQELGELVGRVCQFEDASDLWIALQVPSFVDDIVIGMNGVILWIEAKRGDVTWRTGEERRRIEDNFLAQMNA